MEQLKICRVDHRIFWVIFIILELFIISVMIGTLANSHWVELDPTVPLYTYQGSLIYVEEGLTVIPNLYSATHPFNLKGKTYEKVACGACFVVDGLTESTTPVSEWDFYNAWCKMFGRLWFGAGIFIAFEIFSLIGLVFSIFFLVLFIKNQFYLKASFCAGGCLWISHYVAILGWIGVSNVTFGNDCHDLNSGANPPTVCAKDAPRLGLFLLIFLPFVMIPFFLITCYLKKKHLVKEIQIKVNRIEVSLINNNQEANDVERNVTNEFQTIVKD